MLKHLEDVLHGETCLACQRLTSDDLFRKLSLSRLGSLREFIDVNQAAYWQDNIYLRESLFERDLRQIQQYFCRSCLKNMPFLTYDKIWKSEKINLNVLSAFSYVSPINSLIIQFKFYQKKYLAEYFASLLYLRLAKELFSLKEEEELILTPIPLHEKRYRERGYNQADLIGQKLAEKLGLAYCSDFLIRQKSTKRQTETKGYGERIANLSMAFKINEKYQINKRKKLYRKRIILIDDVLTTGATLEEASRLFISQGYAVTGLSLAREKLKFMV